MKKILVLATTLIGVVSLNACASDNPNPQPVQPELTNSPLTKKVFAVCQYHHGIQTYTALSIGGNNPSNPTNGILITCQDGKTVIIKVQP